MQSLVSVDPFRCRVWGLHDRLEEHITEENCAEEILSFRDHGQLVPVLGRLVHDDPAFDVELICGARRLFVARHLKRNLLIDLRELADRDALVAMDVDNRQRKDISPYERGLSYARWLRGGYFESQDDMARSLNVSSSQVSRLLKLARLPSVVVGAFDTAADIRENWGLHLAKLLLEPERSRSMIKTARQIQTMTPRLCAQEVYRQLLMSRTDGHKIKSASHEKVVKGIDGAPLFRIRQQSDAIVLTFPIEKASPRVLNAIESAIQGILQDTAERSLDENVGTSIGFLSNHKKVRRTALKEALSAPPQASSMY
jgi:ParB family transcriptional regulator, chromosome partitioning protein